MDVSTPEPTYLESSHLKTAIDCSLFVEMITPVEDNRPIFMVGSFNEWRVDEEKYRLNKVSPNHYFLKFPILSPFTENFEYKFVKGGWENQELDSFGNAIPNRVFNKSASFINDFVPRWKNYGLSYNPKYLPKTVLIEEQFYIPQLNKYRRIVALLPKNYQENVEKRYPVMYMHDAQNLFGNTSKFGSWEIDKKLAVLSESGKGNVIIICIDHGGTERTNEFMTIDTPRFGTAEGRKYIDFITKTLKPTIDRKFRTLTDRENTGIGGSSLGGLISIHAGLMYPKIFSKLMIMSPSLWVTRLVPIENIGFFQPVPTKIYAYGGGEENASMVPNINRFVETVNTQGFDSSMLNIKLNIDPKGTHTEKRWGEEFPRAVEWLFDK